MISSDFYFLLLSLCYDGLGPVYYVHPKIIAHAYGILNERDLADTTYDIKIKIV